MKVTLCFLIALCFPVFATKFTSVAFSPESPGLYQKFEIRFAVSRGYDNPFNPTEVQMDAVFTAPSGAIVTVPAFWFQDFERRLDGEYEKLDVKAKAEWRVRFTATELGAYSFYLRVIDIDGPNQSDRFEFEVKPAKSRGFIHVDQLNSRWLSFDDGSFYLPWGQNIGWGANGGTFDYDLYMGKMADAGENWMRIWLTHFYDGQTLEWNANYGNGWYHGLGIYSQQGAWKLDYIIDAAEKNDIYIQFVTQHHGQFSASVNPNWDDNPYNIQNGGFLHSGDEFFIDENAKELYKRKMRYTIARWGYSTAILAWELFNEVQYTDNYEHNYPNVASWHQEMAAFIHSIDPWKHLITTSARDGDDKIWALPELDMTQIHYYGGGVREAVRRRHLSMMVYEKPNIIGEFGSDTATPGDDPSGTTLHQALWSTAMVGGGAMPWWWDSFIHPNNLYYHWSALAAFWRDEDLRIGDFQPIPVSLISGPESQNGARVTPGKGWETSTQHEFTVLADGSVPDLINLSQFLQGSDKEAMGREAILLTSFIKPSVFAVQISSASSWMPGKLQIYIDENTQPQVDATPTPPQRFQIDIPAGEHKIRLFNAGTDWLQIEYIEFSGFGLSAAAGYALSNGDITYAWIYDRDFIAGVSPHGSLQDVTAIFPYLSGEFQVEQWDTWQGQFMEGNTFTDKNQLGVPLIGFTGDMAMKIIRTGTQVSKQSQSTSSFQLDGVYPNPFNPSTRLNINLPTDGTVEITLFDLLGHELFKRLCVGLSGENAYVLDLSGYSGGVYLVRLTFAQQIKTAKILYLK